MIIYDEDTEVLIIPNGLGVDGNNCDSCYEVGYEKGYDEGFEDGQEEVPLEEKNVEITDNGVSIIEPSDGFSGIKRLEVTVNVESTDTREEDSQYTYFIAEEDGCKVRMIEVGAGTSLKTIMLVRKGQEKDIWMRWDGSDILLDMEDRLYIHMDLKDTSSNDYTKFETEGRLAVYGNIRSLCDFNESLKDYGFKALFKNTTITKAPKIDFIKVGDRAMNEMFSGCNNLTEAPKIHIYKTDNNALASMFNSCANITNAPMVEVINVGYFALTGIFQLCSSLDSVTYIIDSMSSSDSVAGHLLRTKEGGTMYTYGNVVPLLTSPSYASAGWKNVKL